MEADGVAGMTPERLEEIKSSLERDDWISGNEAQELIAEVERLQGKYQIDIDPRLQERLDSLRDQR